MGSGRDRSLVISVQVTWLCWSASPRLGSARMRSFVCHQRAAKCQHAHHHPHFRRGTADDFHALCVYAPLTVIDAHWHAPRQAHPGEDRVHRGEACLVRLRVRLVAKHSVECCVGGSRFWRYASSVIVVTSITPRHSNLSFTGGWRALAKRSKYDKRIRNSCSMPPPSKAAGSASELAMRSPRRRGQGAIEVLQGAVLACFSG